MKNAKIFQSNFTRNIIRLYTTKSPKVLLIKVPEIIKQIFTSNKINIPNSEKNYFDGMAKYIGDKCNINYSKESIIYLEFNSIIPYIISFIRTYKIDFKLLPISKSSNEINSEYSKTLQEFNIQIEKKQKQLEFSY